MDDAELQKLRDVLLKWAGKIKVPAPTVVGSTIIEADGTRHEKQKRTRITDAELQTWREENTERRKRKESATPGPWEHGPLMGVVRTLNHGQIAETYSHRTIKPFDTTVFVSADAAFIAPTRTDPVENRIDALLDEVKRLKQQLEDITCSGCEHCAGRCPRGK